MADVGQQAQPPPGLSVQQLDLLPMPCVGLAADGRVTYWNAAAGEQLGVTADAALGQVAVELIAAPADRRLALDALAALRAGAGLQLLTLHAPVADGRPLNATWTLLATRAEDGSFAGAMALCQGVSSNGAAASAPGAQATSPDRPDRQSALLDAIPDTLYVFRRDGLILEFRPSREPEHQPYPLDGYLGKYVNDVVEPVRAATMMQTISEVLESGQPRILEYPVRRPTGPSYREARFVWYTQDTVLALIRNVDARYRAEAEREQTLVALESERRQLDAVLTQMPAMMCITDANGLVRRVNDQFLEMLGVTQEQVIGRAQGSFPFTIVDEAGRPLETPELPSVRALRGERVVTEVGVPREDGLLWLQVHASPIRDEHGNVDGAILTMRDLTAERAAADALRRSEATNRALLEAIPDSIYRVSRDGTILLWRHGRGMPLPSFFPRSIVGLSIDDILSPETARERHAIIRNVLATGLAHVHNYALNWESGETHREVRVVRFDAESVLCLVRNTDPQIKAERERERLLGVVEAERRQLNAVLRQVPNGLLVFDEVGRIVEVNDALAESLGRPKSEIIGLRAPARNPSYITEDGRYLTPDQYPSADALRGIESTVTLFDNSPGRNVWLQVSAAPIRDERDTIVGAVLVSRDVTDERAAAEALRASEARHRALLNAIPDALYRVSRDGTVLERRAPDDERVRLHQVYVGQTLTHLLGTENGGQLQCQIELALETGRPHVAEYSAQANGELLYREARVVALGPEEALMLVRDIGERRRAEQERERLLAVVEAERRRLDAVFRQAPNALLVYDADGRIAEINDALATIMRRPKSEIVGKTATDAGFSYCDEAGRQLAPHELPSARALRGEEVNCVVHGGAPHRPVWLQVSAAPIRDDHGAVVGAMVASRNITSEREAAEALRASEERNRALIEAIPDTIYVGGRDGVITDYRPSGTGWAMPVSAVVGRNVRELWPDDVVAPVMQVVNRALDCGEIQAIDYLIPIESRLEYREARIVPYGPYRVLVLVRDVDAQRRAEQERERLLQKIDSERRRLDVILRQLPHTLIVLGRDGRIEEVNDSFLVAVKLPKERVIGQTTLSFGSVYRHQDGRILAEQELPSIRALAGEEYVGELRIDGPNGQVWWEQVAAAPIRDEHGAITGAILSTRNVTAEREAMAALQASEARMRALLNAIPDSIYVRDRDGMLLDYKPPGDGRPMLLRPEIGHHLHEMWTGPLAENIRRVCREVIDTGEMQFIEYQVPTPLGPAYREARVVRSAPNQMLALVRDIDARKRAEQAVHALNQELEQRVEARTAELEAANHELEAFSYSVSHDLKAPLRGIDGYSRLLWEDYQDRLDDDGRVLLQNVRQGAAQMYQLIDDLLAYSRLERRAIDQFQIELAPIVHGLITERADEIERRGVHLTVNVPEITVQADRDGLAQAVRNLLENAMRFTSATENPEIAISATAHEGCCILSVRDNGIGFDMAYHDRIFEIFQRLHRAEEYPGTGIGLALVRKAMQRMGGRVWAESAPGAGATFYLELPR